MLFKNSRLRAMEGVLNFAGGGIHKRIDENRELLELLQQEVPELLEKKVWLNGWIKSQDDFLTELAKAAQMQVTPGHEPRPFPREIPVNIGRKSVTPAWAGEL